MKCSICEKDIKDRRHYKIHLLRTHKLNPIESETILVNDLYGKENVDKEIERYKNCQCSISNLSINIALLLKLLNLKRTSSEERHTERYKKKYLESIQQRYGNDITNISQVKEIQKKKEIKASKKYGTYDYYLQKCREKMVIGSKKFWKENKTEHLNKLKNIYMQKWGVDNPSKAEHISKKISLTKKELFKVCNDEEKRKITEAARKIRTSNGCISKLEERVWKLLDYSNFKYIHNKFLFGFSWDIIFEDEKVIFEIQGDYYHANPKKYKKTDVLMTGLTAEEVWYKDSYKKEIAELNGYKVFYLWEYEINRMNDFEILNFIAEHLISEKNYENS